jgi:hypothetical protein
MYGVCLDCVDYAWNIVRVCMEYEWNICGICLQYVRNMNRIRVAVLRPQGELWRPKAPELTSWCAAGVSCLRPLGRREMTENAEMTELANVISHNR